MGVARHRWRGALCFQPASKSLITKMNEIKTFKSRIAKIAVDGDKITIKRRGSRTVTFSRKDIISVEQKRSIYDLPIVDTSVFLHLSSGRKVKIKRFGKKQAGEFVELIGSRKDKS